MVKQEAMSIAQLAIKKNKIKLSPFCRIKAISTNSNKEKNAEDIIPLKNFSKTSKL